MKIKVSAELMQLVRDWHAHHTPEYCREELHIERCEIYEAIQRGASDEELIKVVLDVDPEIFQMQRGE